MTGLEPDRQQPPCSPTDCSTCLPPPIRVEIAGRAPGSRLQFHRRRRLSAAGAEDLAATAGRPVPASCCRAQALPIGCRKALTQKAEDRDRQPVGLYQSIETARAGTSHWSDTPPYPDVGRLAVWVRLPRSAAVVHPRAHARSAPHGADSGEGRVAPSTGWAGSSLGLGPAPVQPARLEARHAASASEGRSRATQEREQPLPIGRSPGRAGSPLRLGWGLVQIQPARSKRRQAARASPGRSRATQGREQPLPPRQSPGRAGSPLGWGPAEIQPARL